MNVLQILAVAEWSFESTFKCQCFHEVADDSAIAIIRCSSRRFFFQSIENYSFAFFFSLSPLDALATSIIQTTK